MVLSAGTVLDGTSLVDGVMAIPLPGRPLGPGGDREAYLALPEFVAGPENRLVRPAVCSVLEETGDGYNPLLFCGAKGTGKSHLARGLAAQWKALRPRRRVVCTSAADLARELTDAVETQGMDDFRRRYREAALLVLEDIDRLAGNHDAQEQLVHTLDSVLAGSGRAVLTGLAGAAQLSGIMPRLQSRVESGLRVLLAPPGPGARLALLRGLALLWELKLAEPAARLLAESLPLTVPQLVDVLVQLEVCARLNGGRIDVHAARQFLAIRNDHREAWLPYITATTARLFALRPSELRGRSRRQGVATARAVAMYLARHLTGKSFQQIGEYFGGRDHTTVMHGCRKTERLLKDDPSVSRDVERLQERLQIA
jgi:chromosomal replication initiator protein